MVNALAGGDDRRRDGRRDRLVHGAAPADLRRPHALGDRLPRRRRRDPGRPARWPLGYFGVCGLGALVLAASAGRGRAAPQRRVGGDRHRAGLRPRPRLPLRQPLRAACSTASSRCSSAPSSASPPGRCSTLLWSRAGGPRACSPSIGRPLLFASVDGEVARAAGVPTGLLALAFLLLLGLAVAATARSPARCWSSRCWSRRPRPRSSSPRGRAAGLALSVALALAVTWLGLAIAYFSPYPVGFWVTSLSFGLYVLVRCAWARSPSPDRPAAGEPA